MTSLVRSAMILNQSDTLRRRLVIGVIFILPCHEFVHKYAQMVAATAKTATVAAVAAHAVTFDIHDAFSYPIVFFNNNCVVLVGTAEEDCVQR